MDQSIEYGVNMSHKIDEVMEEDREAEQKREEEASEEAN